jgi:phage shock protein PspC (stress-responsive transcriptional regulator)
MSDNTASQPGYTPPTTPPAATSATAGAATATAPRRLTRVREGKMLAGVSTGLARYLDVDPVAVRVGFVALTLLSGAGFLAYLACWVLMPQE